MKKYDNFCKALDNLHFGVNVDEPYTIVEQTGIVRLFQICYELSWKLMKEILENHGIFEDKISSPRTLIKIAYQCDLIKDETLWLELLDARNIVAHTYSNEQALNLIKSLKEKYIVAFDVLKKEIDERWLDD